MYFMFFGLDFSRTLNEFFCCKIVKKKKFGREYWEIFSWFISSCNGTLFEVWFKCHWLGLVRYFEAMEISVLMFVNNTVVWFGFGKVKEVDQWWYLKAFYVFWLSSSFLYTPDLLLDKFCGWRNGSGTNSRVLYVSWISITCLTYRIYDWLKNVCIWLM